MGQIITALQMVYEEKYVTKYNVPPLQDVGWEVKMKQINKENIYVILKSLFFNRNLWFYNFGHFINSNVFHKCSSNVTR